MMKFHIELEKVSFDGKYPQDTLPQGVDTKCGGSFHAINLRLSPVGPSQEDDNKISQLCGNIAYKI